jgi:hypothetical protein
LFPFVVYKMHYILTCQNTKGIYLMYVKTILTSNLYPC